MSTAAIIGVSTGKQLLRSSFLPSKLAERLASFTDQGTVQFTTSVRKHVLLAKKSTNSRTQSRSDKQKREESLKALGDSREFLASSSNETACTTSVVLENDVIFQEEHSLEALILLQKSLLEKQWGLSLDLTKSRELSPSECHEKGKVVRSGKPSARQRRLAARSKSTQNLVRVRYLDQKITERKQERVSLKVESLRHQMTDYMRGMLNKDLLTRKEVVRLSNIIQTGLYLKRHKSRLKVKLGYEPSDAQWAASMNMSVIELNAKLMKSAIAAEKLALSHIRLVVSIARKYRDMGFEMEDLIQEGLIGLLHGIEKFDSSKGCKFSTYMYWWIRQGITRAIAERSRTIRLPSHLHERLGLIRNAKLLLKEKGVDPSLERIATTLSMSLRKVKRATEAPKTVISIDKEAHDGFYNNASDTLHNCIADTNLENQPWFTVERDAFREDVNKFISSTLTEREQVIIRLYYGMDTHRRCSWEAISKRVGLSRERVRQIGLMSLEKMRNAARNGTLGPIFMQV